MRWIRIATVTVILAALAILGRPWIALAIGAASYPVTASGEAANVLIAGAHAYATLADRGFAVIDVETGRRVAVVLAPCGSVDDLAAADGFLFALDARPPGHLSVFSLADPERPRLVAPPVAVDVGPFSGVSAANGKVIVSGGTSLLSLRTYDARGALSPLLATLDAGRGQPDILLGPDGNRAFISTHRWGRTFR